MSFIEDWLSERGCSCDGDGEDLEPEEQCDGHRIEKEWSELRSTVEMLTESLNDAWKDLRGARADLTEMKRERNATIDQRTIALEQGSRLEADLARETKHRQRSDAEVVHLDQEVDELKAELAKAERNIDESEESACMMQERLQRMVEANEAWKADLAEMKEDRDRQRARGDSMVRDIDAACDAEDARVDEVKADLAEAKEAVAGLLAEVRKLVVERDGWKSKWKKATADRIRDVSRLQKKLAAMAKEHEHSMFLVMKFEGEAHEAEADLAAEKVRAEAEYDEMQAEIEHEKHGNEILTQHLAVEKERAERRLQLIQECFLSADVTWEERNEGHDWADWCERARDELDGAIAENRLKENE